MRIRHLLPVLLLVVFQPKFFGQSKADSVVLRVEGEVKVPLNLTLAALNNFYRTSVKAKDHDEKEYTFEGVPLIEILRSAGVPFGDSLRGRKLALYLLVEGADGYKAVFALPELDPSFSDRVILLANRRNGKPLDEKEGLFRIIVPGEKKHARWIRQVRSFKIVRS